MNKPTDQNSATSPAARREIRFEHSTSLPAALGELNIVVLISTYQAGKLVVVGSDRGQLVQSFHNFDRPMGVAIGPDSLAVAARNQVWMLKNAPDVARRLEPPGRYGACFLARGSRVTGEIQAHEMAWGGGELWIVNTLFSCLCTTDDNYNFVPRWCPPFISALAPEDRCHLNGVAMQAGRPRYVTVMAQTDTAGGWRPLKVTHGCLLCVDSGHVIAEGFAMPHSPRVYRDQIWLLDSGRGRLVTIDAGSGNVQAVADVPGYARGLSFHGNLAFIGLSKIRETSAFDGVPIAEHRERLKCGMAVVDISSGRTVATFVFKSGIDEIFDVAVLPGVRSIDVRGPFADSEGASPIWTVPEHSRRLINSTNHVTASATDS